MNLGISGDQCFDHIYIRVPKIGLTFPDEMLNKLLNFEKKNSIKRCPFLAGLCFLVDRFFAKVFYVSCLPLLKSYSHLNSPPY